MQTPLPLYDDLATLTEKVTQVAIRSKMKLSILSFYDACRALHEFNRELNTVLFNYFDLSFDADFLQNSSFGAPEDKWRFFLNKDLE
jgi:hypothetical protein